jgi:transcriptional regulator with XRE-family HTH domain
MASKSVYANRRLFKALRALKGMSQADLARAVGKSRPWISLIEIDRHRPKPEDLKKLAEVLGVDPEILGA